MKEYQVYHIDSRYKLVTDGKPLFETDCLSEAHKFCHDVYQLHEKEIAIWQPRIGFFRGHYKRPIKVQIFGRIE